MKKNIFVIMIFFTLILTSCGTKQTTEVQNNTPSKQQTQKQVTKTSKEISKDIQQRDENMKKAYMAELGEEQKKIFTDLEEAQKSGDTKKEEGLLKQIQAEKDAKVKALDEAVSKKDDKTAVQLRKELRIYDITLRSTKTIITPTK
ncbi:MAG: hypothetical protein PHN31_05610 [Candidatus Gracilibacteria bacterium]|nr:hypothetical protein [Candidatus Gracilibacteria bacterium]